MSAIAGFLAAPGDPEGPRALERVLDRMGRAPGGAPRTAEASGGGLGSPAAPPFGLPGTGLWIAADALVTNRAEVLGSLGCPPEVLGDAGDGEVLLRAFAAWGEGMLGRVEGEWSLAILDGNRRRVLCARDPFGTRPLYWLRDGERFAFASSARALLATGWIPRRLHGPRLADVFVDVLELHAPEETFFEGIRRLPAGRLLEAGPEGVAVRSGAVLRPGRGGAGAFGPAFRRAVAERLRGAPAPGVMLSGGLDSCSVACAGREHLRATGGGPLRTFTAIAGDGSPCPEEPFARAVLAGGGFDPVLLRPSDLGPRIPDPDRLAASFEEPFDAGVGTIPLLAFAAAGAAGVPALLDGVDGDLATGLDRECVGHAAAAGRWGLALSLARGFGRFHGVPAAGILLDEVLRPAVPRPLRRLFRRRAPAAPGEDLLAGTFLDEGFARRCGVRGRSAEVLRAVYGPRGRGEAAAREHALHRVTAPWLSTALERYGRAAAAFGVEARHPFADRPVVEAALSLPWEARVRGGWPKALLRDTLGDLLPPAVRDRTVAATNLNGTFLVEGLRAEGPGLRDRVEAALGETAGIVDAPRARGALEGFLAGRSGETADALSRLLTLAAWLRAVRAEGAGGVV